MGQPQVNHPNPLRQLTSTEVESSVLEVERGYLGHCDCSRGLRSCEARSSWDELGRP